MADSHDGQQLSGAVSQIEKLTDMYLEQVAVVYVSAELQAQGADMDAIRNAYLLRVGGYMLLMALVMALVSVVTGFISARASAGIGRDLRERLYSKSWASPAPRSRNSPPPR